MKTQDASPDISVTIETPPRSNNALARLNSRARQMLWIGRSLRPRESAGGAGGAEIIDAPSGERTGSGFSDYGATFLAFVVMPAFAVILYLAFLASDQYAAETKFALRTAQADTIKDKSSSALSTSSSGGSTSSGGSLTGLPSLATQDAYVVAAYIHSPAILSDLAPVVNVRQIYSRQEADFWARLPANASLETMTTYWRSMVSSSVDNMSGIVTVTVRAFRADDALALVHAITAASERLVNDLSTRARRDTMTRAEAEVRRAQDLVQTAIADMRTFRDKEGMISPTVTAESTSALLLVTMSERIRVQGEYTTASRVMSPGAPPLASLKARLDAADQEIEKLRSQLTGSGSKTVASSIARYEELELQRQFAEKIFVMSQDALERARQIAERQSVFLTAFVPPYLPEEAQFPKRLHYSLLIPICLLLIWGIFAMLAATIRDHQV
jgi:capsular polysaccharide transport system permease protein